MPSIVPASELDWPICSANSTISCSMTLALTVPRPAMTRESSLISSSSIIAKTLDALSSPTASRRIAAFSEPVSCL